MLERDLNTIIANSIKTYGGTACKIPDPKGGTGIQLPFDIFGAYKGKPLYIESKLIKSNVNAFPFKRVEEHQYHYLHTYKQIIPTSVCLIAVSYWMSRSLFKVFFFEYNIIRDRYLKGEKSFKGKVMKTLPHCDIKKRTFDFDQAMGNIITEEVLAQCLE